MRKKWNFLKNIEWWLLLGILCAMTAAIPGIISSLSTDFSDTIYGVVDWLAASVVYFFLGAFFGHLVDWFVKRKQKISHPDWFWYTLAFWLTGIVLSFLFVAKASTYFAEFLFLPFVYGIFFPAVAYMMLFPGFMRSGLYAKLVLDAIYLAGFLGWLWLTLTRETTTRKLIRRILLFAVFAMLFIGMAGCVRQLAAIP